MSKEGNPISGEFKQRMTAFILTAAILGGASGCAVDKQNVDKPSIETIIDSPTTKDKDGEIPTGRVTTPETPEVVIPEVITPEVEGFVKEGNNYYAKADNVYRIEEGECLQFVTNVEVGGEFGAWSMSPEAAMKVLDYEKSQIPEGELNYKQIIPFDVTKLDGNNIFKIKIIKSAKTDFSTVMFFFDGELPLINVCPEAATDISGNGFLTSEITNVSFTIDDDSFNYEKMESLLCINGLNVESGNPYLYEKNLFLVVGGGLDKESYSNNYGDVLSEEVSDPVYITSTKVSGSELTDVSVLFDTLLHFNGYVVSVNSQDETTNK